MEKYKYILSTEERQGSMKILSSIINVDNKFYGGLNFDFYIKDSLELLDLLTNNETNSFISQYGNKDKFSYVNRCLTKEYKTNKNSEVYKISFNLTEDLEKELINYIIEKYNEYITSEAKRNKIEIKLSNKLDNFKQNINTQKKDLVTTNIESKKELQDFREFNSVMEIDTYLRTNNNAAAFIKWLQDKKIITLNHTYAPQELAKKPVEELVKLREEYLK